MTGNHHSLHLATPPAPLRIGAVILAAGEGSRMGGLPKCLIRMNGQTLIARMQQAMQAMGIARTVVVTGYHSAAIEAELAVLPVEIVRNPDPAAGQQTSVRLGLKALGADTDLVLVALADQPGVGKEELSELISAFRHRTPGTDIVMPMVDGQRGNPVAFSGELIRRLLAGELPGGLRAYIDNHPGQVFRMATGNPSFITDLDTREDVQRYAQASGYALQWPEPVA